MRNHSKRAPLLALLACLANSSFTASTHACPADLSGNGEVDVDDLFAVINAWGESGAADLSQNGVVDVDDLLIVINAWGQCITTPTCDELSWVPTFGGVPGVAGGVHAITVFDDGLGGGPALYVGGSFSVAGGLPINNIAKWNGTSWSPLGSGTSAMVFSLAVFDDGSGSGPALYAGGHFYTAGGVSANHIAKWDGTSWSPLGSGTFGAGGGYYGEVYALAVFDDGSGPALYAGGGFEFAGGEYASGIAKWDGTSWSPVGEGLGVVFALAIFDDGSGSGPALYAGGGFQWCGSKDCYGIAKWDGSTWSDLDTGVWGHVYAMSVFDDGTGGGPALYAAGSLGGAGTIAASNIVKWNGSTWSDVGGGTQRNGHISALTVFDDGSPSGPALYAAGFFDDAGGVRVNNIAKWNGTSWSALESGLGGTQSSEALALTVFDDGMGGGPALFAGGYFNTAGGIVAQGIAKWNDSSWSELGSPTLGIHVEVGALAVFDDGSGGGPALYAGGFFTVADGITVNRIAKWNGTSWSALGSGLNNSVAALTVFDDGSGGGPALYVGGFFTMAGEGSANYIAKWDGSSWSVLGSGTNNAVRALTVFDDGSGSGPALYAGGSFTTAGGVSANHIAKWNGSSWSALGSGVGRGNDWVGALTTWDDGSGEGPNLYLAGNFTTAGGFSANHIAKWNGSSWSALGSGIGPNIHDFVSALTTWDDGSGEGPNLYVGGAFTTAGGQTANRIAKWDGTTWSPLDSGLNNRPYVLVTFDDGLQNGPALFAGGGFASAGGVSANCIAKWNGSSWSALGNGVTGWVGDLHVFDDGSGGGPALFAGGSFWGSPAGDSFVAKWGCPAKK